MPLLSILSGLTALSGLGAGSGAGSGNSQPHHDTESALKTAAGVVDALFTGDDEKLGREQALARIISRSDTLQAQMNSTEAKHRSLLVAGWRPFIGRIFMQTG